MSRMGKYFKKYTKDISFLELRKEKILNINKYLIKEDLPLPIETKTLLQNIENNYSEEINFKDIIDGMIFLIGVDTNFPYKENYIEILKNTDGDIEKYIVGKGLESFNKEMIDRSIIIFRTLYEINSKNKDCLYFLGLALEERSKNSYEQGDRELGDAFLNEAVNYMEKLSDEKDSRAYYKLGYYYKHFSEFKKADIVWRNYISHGKEEELKAEVREELEFIGIDVKYEEGYTKILEGDPEGGLEKLLPLIEVSDNWWNLDFMIGLAYRQLGQNELAIEYFNKVTKINPGQVDSYNEKGLCYANIGNIEKSIEMFSEALRLNPKNNEILCNRGMAYLQNEDIEKAQNDIEEALKIDKEDPITIACYERIRNFAK